MKNLFWLLLAVVATVNSHPTNQRDSRADCIGDYSPCSCLQFGDGTIQVDCEQVSVQDVQDIFNRTTTNLLYRLDWTLPVTEMAAVLPANLLSGKQSEIIRLACALGSSTKLGIDPDAFRSSSGYTNQLILSDCDLAPLDLAFLAGFNVLNLFSIYNSSNIQCLQSLPVLPLLAEFNIFDCSGFEKMTSFPTDALPTLQIFKLNSNQLDDRVVGLILNTIASSSGDTLLSLSVNDNQLTRIPEQLSSFPKLTKFYIGNNNISLIASGSLTFAASGVSAVYLPSVSLRTIEPGTFQGDFGKAQITVDNNFLTRFESAVFQPVLEQMVQQVLGRIYLYSNPIECDCSLAWLIRDNPIMLNLISGGTCSDSTQFSQLDPNDFIGCP